MACPRDLRRFEFRADETPAVIDLSRGHRTDSKRREEPPAWAARLPLSLVNGGGKHSSRLRPAQETRCVPGIQCIAQPLDLAVQADDLLGRHARPLDQGLAQAIAPGQERAAGVGQMDQDLALVEVTALAEDQAGLFQAFHRWRDRAR